jgi:hypothetical protein
LTPTPICPLVKVGFLFLQTELNAFLFNTYRETEYQVTQRAGKLIWFPNSIKAEARQRVINSLSKRTRITRQGRETQKKGYMMLKNTRLF